VVDPSNRGLAIYNLAGEYIGGDSVGGQYGALGDLSDFPEGARVNLIQDQKDGYKYPNRLPLDQRLAIQKQMNDIAYEMDGLEYGDPARNALEAQRNDLWAKSQGLGKYAPDAVIETPQPQYEKNELISPRYTDRKFFDNGDGTITMIRSDGSQQVLTEYNAKTVYDVTPAPQPTAPEPVRPPDSEYIQQDQQEGPVAPEISGPMPAPIPPSTEPVAPGIPTGPEAEVRPIAPTAPVAPAPPAAPTPTTPVGTAPVAPAPPAAPVAPTGDRELTGGPAWARDYKVIERANGQVDFIDPATGQITGQLTFNPEGNLEFDRELRAQFRYAEPTPVAPTAPVSTAPVAPPAPTAPTTPVAPAPVAPTVPTAPTAPPPSL